MKSQLKKQAGAIALSILFVFVGVLHFFQTSFFESIVPPYVPHPTEMVVISGVFEVLGGIGILIPSLKKWAGTGLILLLLAVYPANIHMAVHNELFSKIPPAVLWFRLTLQPLLMYAVWKCTLNDQNTPSEKH